MATLAIIGYVTSLGDIFKIEWHALANIGTLSFLGGLGSLIKSFLTDSTGKFAGVVTVVPTKKSEGKAGFN